MGDAMSEYDEFLDWLSLNLPDVMLTDHQKKVAKAWLLNVPLESVGVHPNSFGKQYVMNLVKRYRRDR